MEDIARDETPKDIATFFELGAEMHSIERYGTGIINDTFLVTTTKRTRSILQRLHHVFDETVLADFEAVTEHLARKKIKTPRLIKTRTGRRSVRDSAGALWRMITFLPGTSYEDEATPTHAREASAVLGTFHNALADLDHVFLHKIPHFHDTAAIIRTLDKTAQRFRHTTKYKALAVCIERTLRTHS